MVKKIVKFLNYVSRGLEIAISVVVLLAVIIQTFSLRGLFINLVVGTDNMYLFQVFLNNVLTIIIGLEFFRMLCFSDADTVLEVIMFVLARHMIVEDTNALENLLIVFGIAIVIGLHVFLDYWRKRQGEKETLEEEIDKDLNEELGTG